MLKKPVFALVLIILVTCLVALPSRSEIFENNSEILFSDDFEETSLDSSKWIASENTNQSGYPAYGGSIELVDGSLLLSSNGSSFPFLYSAVNPFPSSGDFEVEFAVEYTCIGDFGCGVMISNGSPSLDANWHRSKIITVWAHDIGPETSVIFIEFFDSQVYQITVPGFKPSSPKHIYGVAYVNGTYNIYVDGVFVARAESEQRPNMIVFGNPPNPELPMSPTHWATWGYWGWSSLKIDYISVDTEIDTNDNSEQDGSLLPTQIGLSTSGETEQIGYKINIFGTLISNEAPVEDARIILLYSMPGVSVWLPISSTTTNSEGFYSASWIPTATGEFTLKAEYHGDGVFAPSVDSKNISIADSVGNDVLFVESNSTLSSLVFNSTSYEVSFTVNGGDGTKGYVSFTVSKKMVPEPENLSVYLDGNELEYTVTDLADRWQLNFAYAHSKHTVLIVLPQPSVSGLILTTVTIIAFTALAAAGIGSIIFFRRRNRKAATV